MAAVVLAAAALGVTGTIGSCGPGATSSESSSTVGEPPGPGPRHSSTPPVAARNEHHRSGPVNAKMADVSFASSAVEWPQNGGWRAETRHSGAVVIVVVGGDARSAHRGHPPRNGWIEIDAEAKLVPSHPPIILPGTGAITLSKAPTGTGLPRSTFRADIAFMSQSGITGTIHLKDETVTLNR
jgi:hypothetical protein